MEKAYENYIRSFLDKAAADGDKIGAFLLEPLMLGAGGLKFIDPLFQSVSVRECKSRGIPVVYDEVSEYRSMDSFQ